MSIKEFNCKICNKFYVSYKTLWEHNKKFHKNESNTDVAVCCGNVAECCGNVTEKKNETNKDVVENKKKIICKYCNKCFNHRSNKFNHEKICKLKNNNSELEIIELKKENKEIKKENEEIKNSLKELKELIIKNSKIHPKKLQKINKDLMNSQNTIIINFINVIFVIIYINMLNLNSNINKYVN